MERKYVNVNENKVHYLESGKGNTLILLPSFGLTSRSYKSFGDLLTKKYHVIIPDLYNGKSSTKKIAYSFSDYVELLNSFVNKLNIKNFFLVGISFAGVKAFNYVQKYPNKVKKLLLASITVVPFNSNVRWFFYSYLKVIVNNMLTWKGLQANLLWLFDGLNNFLRHPKQIIQDIVIATRKYKNKIEKINVPTILLFAKKDEAFPYHLVKQMQNIKNLKIKVIDDYHPWFFIDKEKFVNEIEKYCI